MGCSLDGAGGHHGGGRDMWMGSSEVLGSRSQVLYPPSAIGGVFWSKPGGETG